MAALTDYAEAQTLNWLTQQAAPNAPIPPVLPLRIGLVVVIGTDAVRGTEVVGGGYIRQIGAFGPGPGGQSSNLGLVRYDNMPEIIAPGVVGFEIWDSAATPIRWWWAPLTTARTYTAGDAAEFPPGELVLAID